MFDCTSPIITHNNNMSSAGSETLPLVVNELLCFVVNKLRVLPDDTVIQLCRDFYDEETVEESKKLLFKHCAEDSDPKDRYIARNGETKKIKHLKDILDFVTRKGNSLKVTFVVENVMRMPCVSFDNIDVSILLMKMERMETEVTMLRKAVAAQAAMNAELQTITQELSGPILSNGPVFRQDEQRPMVFHDGIAQDLTPVEVDSQTMANNFVEKNVDEPSWSQVVKKQRWRPTQNIRSTPAPSLMSPPHIPTRPTISPVLQKRPVRKPVVGKGKNKAIGPAKKRIRLANVFVSRLDPQLQEVELQNYLADALSLSRGTISIENVKRSDWHSSFHVKCECTDPSIFMDAEIWPEDAYVRWWREAKPNVSNTKSDYSPSDDTLPKTVT